MTGYDDWNIPTFVKVRDKLKGKGYDVVLPVDMEKPDADHPPTDFAYWLSRDIELILQDCDGIIVLPEWERSRGAKLEVFTGLMKWLKCPNFEFYRYINGDVDRLSAAWIAARLMWKWRLYSKEAGKVIAA